MDETKNPSPAPTRERGASYAIWLLGRRDYSRTKLRRKLEQKGYGEFAEAILDELVERGYLREEAYAEARVRGWIRKGYAESHILRRARSEGFEIAPERVRELFAECGVDESAQARALIQKKLRRLGEPTPGAADDRERAFKRRRSLAAYAIRKGHDLGKVFELVDQIGARISDTPEGGEPAGE